MPIFHYEALSTKGKLVKGTIDADTSRDAREKLRRQEIRVTTMRKADAAKRKDSERKAISLERKINIRSLAILTRQLSTLLGSGIHLAEALGALIEQVGDRKTEMVLRDVREKVVSGMNLAEAMSFHPTVFSDLYVNMVRDVVRADSHAEVKMFESISAIPTAAATPSTALLVFGALGCR
ncbi:MAG: type II secretion system F family protein, partial [Planctomycetota bacterium]